jgi:hypothetical protein
VVNARWIAAGVATAVAVGVVVVPRWPKPEPPPSTVDDPVGDVVGVAPDVIGRALDLTGATLAHKKSAYLVSLHLAQPLDLVALGDRRVDYVVEARAASLSYVVRIAVSGRRAAASVTAGAEPGRPYVLPPPEIGGSTVRVTIPDKAMPRLPARFGWGVTTNGEGSQDRAPSDLSAVYPGTRSS